MPFIAINTTQKLENTQKQKLKSELGSLITIIPGKSESTLMIDISDSHSMYFKGVEMENCAYIDIKLFGAADFDKKADFTKAVYQLLSDVLGLKDSEIYITFNEFNSWGTQGELKQ